MKKIILISFFLIIPITSILSQTSRSGKMGIGYSGNFSTRTNELNFVYWLGEHTIIEPKIGFQYIELKKADGISWMPGLGIAYVIGKSEVNPYLGGRVKAYIANAGGKSYSDVIVSFVFGGEYFISGWFSMGAEMRLNYVSTDENLSPLYGTANATIIETEQVVNIKLYFN